MSNGIATLIPALYAWLLYGWKIGLLLFAIVLPILAALSWAVVFDKVSPRFATIARVVLIAEGYEISIFGERDFMELLNR